MDYRGLVVGMLLLFSGLNAIVWPERRRRTWEARKAELDSGRPERFFEERRALDAYPPRSVRTLRLAGAAMVVAGLGVVALALT